jgi:hypothetical protein
VTKQRRQRGKTRSSNHRAFGLDGRAASSTDQGGGKGVLRSRGEITRLGLEPLADVTGAPLTVGWPILREAAVDDVVALVPSASRMILAARSGSSQSIACARRLAMRVLLADDLDGILPG